MYNNKLKKKKKKKIWRDKQKELLFSKVAYLSVFVKKGKINDHIALTNQQINELFQLVHFVYSLN